MYRAIGVVKGTMRMALGKTISEALFNYVRYWNVDPQFILTSSEYWKGGDRVLTAIRQLGRKGISYRRGL